MTTHARGPSPEACRLSTQHNALTRIQGTLGVIRITLAQVTMHTHMSSLGLIESIATVGHCDSLCVQEYRGNWGKERTMAVAMRLCV